MGSVAPPPAGRASRRRACDTPPRRRWSRSPSLCASAPLTAGRQCRDAAITARKMTGSFCRLLVCLRIGTLSPDEKCSSIASPGGTRRGREAVRQRRPRDQTRRVGGGAEPGRAGVDVTAVDDHASAAHSRRPIPSPPRPSDRPPYPSPTRRPNDSARERLRFRHRRASRTQPLRAPEPTSSVFAFARAPPCVIALRPWAGSAHDLHPPRFDSQCANPREKPSSPSQSTPLAARVAATGALGAATPNGPRSTRCSASRTRSCAASRRACAAAIAAATLEPDGARERGVAQARRVAVVRDDVAPSLQAHRRARDAPGADRGGAAAKRRASAAAARPS